MSKLKNVSDDAIVTAAATLAGAVLVASQDVLHNMPPEKRDDVARSLFLDTLKRMEQDLR